jgi:CRP/FNR family cyclic AMP-dependent transcriptional regulator
VKATVNAGRARIAETLRRAQVFASCSDAVIEGFTARSRFARLRKDRSAVEQGLTWPYLGIVADGALQAVLTSESGREHSLFDVRAGDVFGEISFLDGGTTVLRYVAATDAAGVVLIPADIVRNECAVNPLLTAALSNVATGRTRTILDRFASYLALPATKRIANLLLELAGEERKGETGRALSAFTQVQLARMAGTVREVVQRILASFQTEGIVRLERGRVIALDRTRLMEYLE